MRKQLFISDLANGAAWVALRLAQGAPRQLPEAIARLQSQEPVLPRQSEFLHIFKTEFILKYFSQPVPRNGVMV